MLGFFYAFSENKCPYIFLCQIKVLYLIIIKNVTDMSTELKTLKGKFHSQKTNEMESTELSLTRFSGGKEGMKLQLTMKEQGDFFTHITLNKEELKTLVKEIQENFDL